MDTPGIATKMFCLASTCSHKGKPAFGTQAVRSTGSEIESKRLQSPEWEPWRVHMAQAVSSELTPRTSKSVASAKSQGGASNMQQVGAWGGV